MRAVGIVRVGDQEWATDNELAQLGLMSARVNLTKKRGASSCDLVIDDHRGELANSIALPHKKNGPEVEVWFGYKPSLRQVFSGRMSTLQVQFLPNEVQITANDHGKTLRKTSKARNFASGSAAQFVKTIAEEAGLTPLIKQVQVLEATRFSELLQHGESNADLLDRVLSSMGWESFIRGDKLHVRPEVEDFTKPVEVQLGRHVIGRPTFTVAEFTRRRTPNVYDATGESVFDDTDIDPEVIERLVMLDQTGMLLTAEEFPSYSSQAIQRAMQAQAKATDVFRGTLTLEANPELDVSESLLLRGFGARWNGIWRIADVKHDLVASTTTVDIYNGGAP